MSPTLRRLAAVLGLVVVGSALPAGVAVAAPADQVRVSEQRIEVPGASLDATLYLPASSSDSAPP